jgi:hypothetical protein
MSPIIIVAAKSSQACDLGMSTNYVAAPCATFSICFLIIRGHISQQYKAALQMEMVCFSEVFVTTYKSTCCCYPGDQYWFIQCHENLQRLLV